MPLYRGSRRLILRRNVPVVASGDAAETTAFLARADAITTVGATERSAYKALINGLVADGVFAKLDALYIFATDTSAHALLSLVSATFNATISGTPSFTVDRGFVNSGVDTIGTAFNPATATTPKYVQNSAHFSVWSNTAGSSGGSLFGTDGVTQIYTDLSGSTYYRLNDSSGSSPISSTPTGDGFYLASRASSSVRDGYWNATSLGTTNSVTSTTVPNANFVFMTVPGQAASAQQASMGSIGGALTATDAGNFYSRVRTYMTAVGVP